MVCRDSLESSKATFASEPRQGRVHSMADQFEPPLATTTNPFEKICRSTPNFPLDLPKDGLFDNPMDRDPTDFGVCASQQRNKSRSMACTGGTQGVAAFYKARADANARSRAPLPSVQPHVRGEWRLNSSSIGIT